MGAFCAWCHRRSIRTPVVLRMPRSDVSLVVFRIVFNWCQQCRITPFCTRCKCLVLCVPMGFHWLPKPLVAGSIPVSRSIFVFLFSLSLATARNKGSVGIRKQFKKLPQVSAEQRGAEPGAPGRGPRLAQNDTLKITRQHTSSQ